MPSGIRKVPSTFIRGLCLLRPDLVTEPEWESIVAECLKLGIQLQKIDESYFAQPDPCPLPHFIIHCQSKLHPQLCKFDLEHPNIIIDHPNDIKTLFRRDTMLKCVENLRISQVGIPKQKFVMNDYDFTDLVTKNGGGLKFPMIIKTMEAGGSKASHIMHYALTVEHLVELKITNTISFPFVVQEFNDHGGRFTKVYVLGSQVWCAEMQSTEDSDLWNVVNNKVVTMYGNRRQSTPEISESSKLMEQIASGLRNELKLDAFNLDVIKVLRASGQHEFLIVDINYFPGYSKFENYVSLMSAYFQEIARRPKTFSHSLDLIHIDE